ncbi:MAG: hypothetical protein ACHQ0J_13480 [Candidatus Dormibacterales bacterium]
MKQQTLSPINVAHDENLPTPAHRFDDQSPNVRRKLDEQSSSPRRAIAPAVEAWS